MFESIEDDEEYRDIEVRSRGLICEMLPVQPFLEDQRQPNGHNQSARDCAQLVAFSLLGLTGGLP